jgi:hypothetical protein
MFQSPLHFCSILPLSRDCVRIPHSFNPRSLNSPSNRTLEDLDAYFDVNSGHKTIIAIGDKIAKSSTRPLEAIEAEESRIANAAVSGKDIDGGKGYTSHIEVVSP